MKVTPLALPEVLLIEADTYQDNRGWFMESWQAERYAAAGIPGPFVQDNVSSSRRGVLRGMHCQWPAGQGKLASAVAGRVLDVVVDVRIGSPTFGEFVAHELSDENHHQLWVPPGFAHGFQVLSDTATFIYKVTVPYRPEHEVAIAWNDPRVGIAWPIPVPILGNRDANASSLASIPEERLPVFVSRS